MLDDEGVEPSTFRMQNGRSTTELNAPNTRNWKHICYIILVISAIHLMRRGTQFLLSCSARTADVPKRLRGWTRNPLGSARAGSSPAVCVFFCRQNKSTSRGARTHDHKVKSLALYRLS